MPFVMFECNVLKASDVMCTNVLKASDVMCTNVLSYSLEVSNILSLWQSIHVKPKVGICRGLLYIISSVSFSE